jgi:hypothetical protein
MNHPCDTAVVSRRTLIRGAALFTGGAMLAGAVIARPTRAAAKMPKSAVSYQEKPKGSAQCDNCNLWQTPDACKLVDGKINPAGWCTLYVRKT